MADPVTDYLKSLNTSDDVRAEAWDAAHIADGAEAEQRLRALPFSDAVKADLWDLRQGKTPPKPAAKPAPPKSLVSRGVDAAVDALPAVGGAVGGIGGGIGGSVFGLGFGGVPGAMGGAAFGGATGEAAKQLINRARGAEAPATSTAAATGIAKQGAVQGASEVAGRGIVKGASMAAHGLMDFAIRPAPTVAEEFGDIAGTAIKERLPVGSVLPGSQKGSVLARIQRGQSAANTTNLLRGATAAGMKTDAGTLARGPVTEMVGEIAKQPLSDAELRSVSKMFAEYMDNHAGQLTPLAVKDLKQSAQGIAKPILRARSAGNIVPAGETVKANFNTAIADGSKEYLETIPGVGASEARTRGLIGATKAIKRAEVRRLPLVAEVAAPVVGGVVGGVRGDDIGSHAKNATTGIGAAVLTRALLSPRSTSRAALGLTDETIQQILRQMPRTAVYTLVEALQEQGNQEQGQQP